MTDKDKKADGPDYTGVQWDLKGEMTYGRYLGLPKILSAQSPLSEEHDEPLFIVIHQVSELWMKLVLHELGSAREHVIAEDLEPAFKMLSRVARIQSLMIQAWEVLATMTPADYMKFRDALGPSSGFQSYQYRQIEFMLGAKNAQMMTVHETDPPAHSALAEALARTSIYDETLRLLARRGFAIPAEVLDRDFTQPYVANPAVEAAWLEIYRNVDKWWDLYELGEKLVDLEYRLQQWRFAHLKTVERIIGFKRGTGGSSGVNYLAAVLQKGFFPELLSLRTAI